MQSNINIGISTHIYTWVHQNIIAENKRQRKKSDHQLETREKNTFKGTTVKPTSQEKSCGSQQTMEHYQSSIKINCHPTGIYDYTTRVILRHVQEE